MKKQKLLTQGAEAKILLLGKNIIKDRIKKSYRIKELDNKIRKQRTKKEAKLMLKASKIINVPLPLTDNKPGVGGWGVGGGANFQIRMPFIDGKKLSDYLDKFPVQKQKQICKQIGKDIVKLHDSNIIHGDLTTSNMILVKKIDNKKISDKNQSKVKSIKKDVDMKKGLDVIRLTPLGRVAGERASGANKPIIFFIDFGLGFISHKLEDKAVDLHLLKQALEAKHFQHWEILWKAVESGYKNSNNAKKVFERLKAVEKRGRYKKH